jgi:hypothetical protein
VIPIAAPEHAIEAGILAEFSIALFTIGALSIVTFVLRMFRGR